MKTWPLTSATSTARGVAATMAAAAGLELGRHAEVAGEMIERAQRQDAQRHARAGEEVGGTVDAAVAAADHDAVQLACAGLVPSALQRWPHLRAGYEEQLGPGAGRGERGRQPLAAAHPRRAAAPCRLGG